MAIIISSSLGFNNDNKNKKNFMIIIQTGKISKFNFTLLGEIDFT